MKELITIQEFERKFPLVKIIEVGTARYAYDAKSGMLAQVTEHELTQVYKTRLLSEHADMPNYLMGLLRDGVFLPGPYERITPTCGELDNIIADHISNVIPKSLLLEVTEDCNLRCKYCFFSKEDGFAGRKHNRKYMSEETARKAMDHYFRQYSAVVKETASEADAKHDKPMLQWWGGEPFTAFELIAWTKSYFESLDWDSCGVSADDITYGLTTNLTILNDQILNFLVDNDVKLRVSLDGDQQSNDTNRVFANGKGTFEVAINNLELIIERYPEYAKRSVGIQSVAADNIDAAKAHTFIRSHFELDTPTRKLLACSVSPQRSDGRFMSDLELMDDTSQTIEWFGKRLDEISCKSAPEIEELLKQDKSLSDLLFNIISVEDKLQDSPKGSDTVPWMFSCPLAADLIFVAADGRFHCCAKTDYSFPFGDIENGVDHEKLKDLYHRYQRKTERQCKGCWAYNFCTICPATSGRENEFYLPISKECEKIRKNAQLKLSRYILLTDKYEHLYSIIKSF